MKLIIMEDKLQALFNGMMSEFANLSEHERAYDYYEGRGSYVDYTPINFYNEDDDEWWEYDNFIFQYAEKPPYDEPVEGFHTPILIYHRYRFRNMLAMFGNKFNDLIKNWFILTYGYPVNQVIDDYQKSEFVKD